MRALLAAGLIATGCAPVATMRGARVLEAGERQTHVAVSALLDPVVQPGALPIAGVDVVLRRPVAPDVDVGFGLLGGAPGADLRIRAARTERIDLALAPTVRAAYFPATVRAAGALRGTASLDLSAPLIGQYDLGRGMSLSGGLRPGLRASYVDTTGGEGAFSDDYATVDLLLGGGLRFERRGVRGGWAVNGDVTSRPWRGAPVAGSVTFEILLVRHVRRARLRRAMRDEVRR